MFPLCSVFFICLYICYVFVSCQGVFPLYLMIIVICLFFFKWRTRYKYGIPLLLCNWLYNLAILFTLAESLLRTLYIWLRHINWQLIFRVSKQGRWVYLSGWQTHCQNENKWDNSIQYRSLHSSQVICTIIFLGTIPLIYFCRINLFCLWLMLGSIISFYVGSATCLA